MNVLVLAPHPDDESIGCGGTLCLHTDRGDRVVAVFLTSGELGLKHLAPEVARQVREREAEHAATVLGLAATHFLRFPDWDVADHAEAAATAVRAQVLAEAPDFIYLPHSAEWHPDHQASLPILQNAGRGLDTDRWRLRMYEVWTPLQQHDHVEDVSQAMRRKLKAIRCHASQLGRFRYDRAMRGLNRYRGEMAGYRGFAEVFREVTLFER